jgi:transcription elongation factor S-II
MITNIERQSIIEKLGDIFDEYPDKDKIGAMCKEIEHNIFKEVESECNKNYSKNLIKGKYSDLIGNLLINLDKNSSVNNGVKPDIVDKIYNEEININDLIHMNSFELNPLKTAELKEYLNLRQNATINKKFLVGKRCKFCQEEKVTYFEKQTRSLDEPKTMFYECDNCDKTWT